ncbi:hypothetical protein [Rhodococcus sp. WAY2]|uniref:hypothetical protein n=1 Tax=Rhodococcus sp. WAY2 TaxID=2663121 RepID=UPI00131FF34B|nr:hypothetical protein [Rhodococcus sp. WAY2]QHE73990.1 hypothetical protein GFS60_07665 [Rhodococcus sp. WAY2]
MRTLGSPLLAHGLGGSTDLPIPFAFAFVGAAWALSISFAILVFAWRTPRLRADTPGWALPGWVSALASSGVTRAVVAGLGLTLTAWVGMAAFFGPAESAANALPGTFYVLLWVGLVALSLLFGPVWRLISPVRSVHWLLCAVLRRSPADAFVQYRERWGYWPAVTGLFALVWLELVSSDPGSVAAIRAWCITYLVVTLTGTIVCGTRWCERADPFEVYSTLVSRLSAVGRGITVGMFVLRMPLNNLTATEVRSGSVALTATLLGSTAFDSFSARPWWRNAVDHVSSSAAIVNHELTATVVRTAGLLLFVTVVGASFWIAARAVPGLPARERAKLPGLLSYSLIPIIVGYVFAHYLTYLVEKGQVTAVLLVDPLGRGWDPLGLSERDVSYVLSAHPTLLASLKVLFVLTGHVLGVIAAHDRSLRLLPKRHQLSGQLALLLTMVVYTVGGLYLLFGG